MIGVLNIVSGFGPTAGASLPSHIDVDKVDIYILLSLNFFKRLSFSYIVPFPPLLSQDPLIQAKLYLD